MNSLAPLKALGGAAQQEQKNRINGKAELFKNLAAEQKIALTIESMPETAKRALISAIEIVEAAQPLPTDVKSKKVLSQEITPKRNDQIKVTGSTLTS